MLKKRIIAAILCLACVAFSGCGNTANSGQSESTQSSVTEKSQVEPSEDVSQVSETAEPSKEESRISENSKTGSNVNGSDADSSNATSSKTESSKAESSKISETSKTNQSSQSSKTEESSKSSQTSKSAENSQNSQNSQASQTPNSGQTSQTSKPAETSKPTETSKPAETSKPTETSKPSQTSTPSQPSKPATVSVNSISLNKSSMTLTVGESSKLTATINPSNATNKNFSWVNSNTSVISIDNNGNVKVLKAGTATITAKTSNGKTAVCNVTVKAKETSQPAKKKVTRIGTAWNTLSRINFTTTPGSKEWGFKVWPAGADITNLKITFSDNIKKYIQISNIRKMYTDEEGTYDDYNFNITSAKVTQDLSGTYTISCDGVSATGEIALTSDYDPRYANYYPPFTEAKRNAILKDMREYGEKLGMEWKEDLYVKWNYSTKTYTTNAGFNFPKTVGYNDDCIVGKALYDYLVVRNFNDTYKAYFAPHNHTWTDYYFKVEAWHNPNDDRDWEFYVLFG